jgi:hypothetical protein
MKYKSEAATERAAATSISGVTCEADSTLAGFHIKKTSFAFSVYAEGKRIASALSMGAAIRLARQACYE